jgi:biotin transporter BioY
MIARVLVIVIFPFFMAAMSQIQFTWACLSNSQPVPVTAQTLAAMFAGMLLGPYYGSFATLLYIACVFVGAPFAAAHKSVPIYEPGGLGPTGGYIIGEWGTCCT